MRFRDTHGRFISEKEFARQLERYQRQLDKHTAKGARSRHTAAQRKTDDARAKYQKEAKRSDRWRKLAAGKLEKFNRQLEQLAKPERAKEKRERKKKAAEGKPLPRPGPKVFEVKFSYTGRKNQHKLALNARLTWLGPGPAPSDVLVRSAVMRTFQTGVVQPGWQLEKLDWQHPGAKGDGPIKEGGEKDLDAFGAIAQGVGIRGFTIGAVKEG